MPQSIHDPQKSPPPTTEPVPASEGAQPKVTSACQTGYTIQEIKYFLKTKPYKGTSGTSPDLTQSPTPVAAHQKISLPLDLRKGGDFRLTEAAVELAMSQVLAARPSIRPRKTNLYPAGVHPLLVKFGSEDWLTWKKEEIAAGKIVYFAGYRITGGLNQFLGLYSKYLEKWASVGSKQAQQFQANLTSWLSKQQTAVDDVSV